VENSIFACFIKDLELGQAWGRQPGLALVRSTTTSDRGAGLWMTGHLLENGPQVYELTSVLFNSPAQSAAE